MPKEKNLNKMRLENKKKEINKLNKIKYLENKKNKN